MPSIRALDVERIEEVSDVLAARMLRVTLLLHDSEDREFSIIGDRSAGDNNFDGHILPGPVLSMRDCSVGSRREIGDKDILGILSKPYSREAAEAKLVENLIPAILSLSFKWTG